MYREIKFFILCLRGKSNNQEVVKIELLILFKFKVYCNSWKTSLSIALHRCINIYNYIMIPPNEMHIFFNSPFMDKEEQHDFDSLSTIIWLFITFLSLSCNFCFFLPFLPWITIRVNIIPTILHIRKSRHCYYCLNYSYLTDTYSEFLIL